MIFILRLSIKRTIATELPFAYYWEYTLTPTGSSQDALRSKNDADYGPPMHSVSMNSWFCLQAEFLSKIPRLISSGTSNKIYLATFERSVPIEYTRPRGAPPSQQCCESRAEGLLSLVEASFRGVVHV